MAKTKCLESQVDSLINPIKENEKKAVQSVSLTGSLRDEIVNKIVDDLSGAIKMFNLYKINQKRDKEKRKIMLSIKYIFEEVIILVLIIAGIMKINVWSFLYFIFTFFLIFTRKSITKFFFLYCFEIFAIIFQIISFVTNIQESIMPRKTDDDIIKLIQKHLGIPWVETNILGLSFFLGIGVDKNQINCLYYEYFLSAILYIYLVNFTYSIYIENDTVNRLVIPSIKGNILYDALADNSSLKNREIKISKKDFFEIKRVVKKNTFIENVTAIRYDDFLIALK